MDAIVIAVLIAVVIAAIAVGGMIARMRPVSKKQEAVQYTSEGDIRFMVREDHYIRTDVVRRRIERRR